MGVRVQKKDVIRIFDKLDTSEIGLVAHEDLIRRLFPDTARLTARDERADSDVRVALRKRQDLMEELVSQLKTIESKSEYVVSAICAVSPCHDSLSLLRRKTLDDLLTVFRKADYDKSGALGKADFAE
jgi:hypothetical protein